MLLVRLGVDRHEEGAKSIPKIRPEINHHVLLTWRAGMPLCEIAGFKMKYLEKTEIGRMTDEKTE
jgi:hypothetical protein